MAELNSCNELCIFFLSVLGLWPYGSKKFRLFTNIFVSVNVWFCLLVQVLAFTTTKMTLYRVIKNLSLMTVSMCSLIKYHTIWYQRNMVKGFIDQIKFHWQTNNDVILQILQKYKYLGKQLSTLFASFIFSSASMNILCHLSPIILNKIAPLNESRPVKFPVDFEFFFDKEKHLIPSTFIYYLWIVINAIVYVGTESFTIVTCFHIASLFEVTSYYFQTAVSIEITDSCIPRKRTNNKNMSYLIKSVIIHEKAMQFCSDCIAHFKFSYIPVIMLGVTSLSINLFFLSQSMLYSADVGETMIYLLLVVSIIQYMFFINLAVQYMLDGAANISTSIYNISWYETSVATQKLLQMVILKSNRGFTVTIYNIFEASLRGFSVLFRTSLSYFTVLISL